MHKMQDRVLYALRQSTQHLVNGYLPVCIAGLAGYAAMQLGASPQEYVTIGILVLLIALPCFALAPVFMGFRVQKLDPAAFRQRIKAIILHLLFTVVAAAVAGYCGFSLALGFLLCGLLSPIAFYVVGPPKPEE